MKDVEYDKINDDPGGVTYCESPEHLQHMIEEHKKMKANVHVKNLQKLIDRIDELEKEKIAFINTNHNLADRIEGLKEDNKKLSKDLSWWQDNFHDVKQDRDTWKKKANSLEADMSSWRHKALHIRAVLNYGDSWGTKSECDDLKKEVTELKGDRDTWKKECIRLKEDKVEADRIIAGLEVRNLRLTKENERLEYVREGIRPSWKNKADFLAAECNKLRIERDEWKGLAKDSQKKREKLQEEVDRLKNANRVMEEERDSWMKDCLDGKEEQLKNLDDEVLGNTSEIIEYLLDRLKSFGHRADDRIFGLRIKDPKTYRRDCVDKKRKLPEWAKRHIHGDWANSEASSGKQNGVKQAEEGADGTKDTFVIENLVKKYSNAHLDKKRRPLSP